MFTIIPYGRGHLPGDDGSDATDLLASLVPDTQLCDPAQRPFVELSHQEIPEVDVEAVLGYAGITKANAPVGLPGDFEPRTVARNCLLFPLSGLEAHLRRTDAGVIAEYERHSTIEQFLESRDMSARDYLVAGLLECIKWCRKHRAALTIRW
jgi:hypothetical protein